VPHPLRRYALPLLGFLTLATPALAADLDDPYPRRPPPPAWAAPGPEGPCRVFLRHRPGPYGDEVRRVRVCDEPGGPPPPRWSHDDRPPGPPRWAPGRYVPERWQRPAFRGAYEPHDRPPLVPDDASEE
jgi:hypothetical protein